MTKDKLNPKRRRFVTEYLKDQNGTQAAIRAGYSKHTANEQAAELLAIPSIRAAVDEKLEKLQEKVLVSKEFVIGGLKEVAQRCMAHVPVMEFDRESKEMVQKMKFDEVTGKEVGVYDFDSTGANRSLELLGKHLSLFSDKVILQGGIETLLDSSQCPR